MEDLRFVAQPPEVGFILEETARVDFGMASEPLVGALLRTLAAQADFALLPLVWASGVVVAVRKS